MSDPFKYRHPGFADETPAAVTAFRVSTLNNPPEIHEVFYPGRGWTRCTGIPVDRKLTNRTAVALRQHGVTAVEVVIDDNRFATFTIHELVGGIR